MLPAEFKGWRSRLGLTQEEAARRLEKTRVTVQNWENGTTPVSLSVELHCRHLEEEHRRRPDYGAVVLLCAGGHGDAGPYYNQTYADNEAAISKALEIWDQLKPGHPMINDATDRKLTIWSESALRKEIERRIAGREGQSVKPGLADRLMELGRHFSSLPVYDDRSPDEILGYDENGLPR